jgi:glucose-1-phosphate adenylyltransferase
MEQTRVFIVAGGRGSRLYPLTKQRAKPAVPFAGNSRLIDCALSSCIYSGLRRVHVLAYYLPDSLSEHVEEKWRVVTPVRDEYVRVQHIQARMEEEDRYFGDADAVGKNLYLFDRRPDRRVLVLGGNHIYKGNFRRMIEFHKERGSRLTISAFESSPQDVAGRLGYIGVEGDRVVEFREKPSLDDIAEGTCLASMGIYLFDVDFLREALGRGWKVHSFGSDLLPALLEAGAEGIHAYNFTELNSVEDETAKFEGTGRREEPAADDSSYFRDAGTLESLWEANMELVEPRPPFDLYSEGWKLPGEPPAKDVQRQVLFCSRSFLSSSRVHRVVLSPGASVGEGAEVTESVIFERARIGKNAVVRRAIIDKDVEIPPGFVIDGRELSGYGLERGEDYVVTESGITVIAKGVKIL